MNETITYLNEIYFISTISKETSLESQHRVKTTFPFINTSMYICDELSL